MSGRGPAPRLSRPHAEEPCSAAWLRCAARAVRPADGHSLAITQRGTIGGLARPALRFSFPQGLDDLMQPCPPLRRDACAALIDLAAAAPPAPAGFVAARAP